VWDISFQRYQPYLWMKPKSLEGRCLNSRRIFTAGLWANIEDGMKSCGLDGDAYLEKNRFSPSTVSS
jgi:hypothetical protein